MSTNHTPEVITAAASEQIAMLLNRQWPEISAIIEEEGEVKISASIHVTDRDAEEGNHADKDRRVKTTISFSRKFTDTTEKALEDPSQPSLFDERAPYSEEELNGREPESQAEGAQVTTDGTVGGDDEEQEERHFSGAEMPDGYQAVTEGHSQPGDIALNVERTEWVNVASAGARWDEYHGLARKKEQVAKEKRPRGWAEAALKAGQTGVAEALAKAAVGLALPPVPFLQNELSTGAARHILKEFRRGAKKAQWPVVAVETMVDILEQCDSPLTMMATLQPHIVAPAAVPQTTVSPVAAEEQSPFDMEQVPAAPAGAEVTPGGEVPDSYEMP